MRSINSEIRLCFEIERRICKYTEVFDQLVWLNFEIEIVGSNNIPGGTYEIMTNKL